MNGHATRISDYAIRSEPGSRRLVPSCHQHRRSQAPGAAASARGRLRVHRRRRRGRGHACARTSTRFRDVTFRPRQCVAVPTCDLRTTVLGTELALPFMLAPVGFCRMFYPRGEVVAAREASAAGTGYILSTFSGTRLEEVRAGHERSALVSALRAGRPRGGRSDDRARESGRLHRARRDHRYAGRRHARARLSTWREASAAGQVLGERAARGAIHHASALGDGLPGRRRTASVSERRVARCRARCPAATWARCSSRRS